MVETPPDTVDDYMKANTEYKFCIPVQNPKDDVACSSPKLTLNADGASKTYSMTVDTSTYVPDYGDAGFACPGLVSEKRFLRATVRQSSNVTGVESNFFVEMLLNAELKSGESATRLRYCFE